MSVAGRPVSANDVQQLAQRDGPRGFVRLCGAVIGAALSEALGQPGAPELTERIHLADGGIDATAVLPSGKSESRGLLGPGKTVFQFKTVELGYRGRASLLDSLVRKLEDGVATVVRELKGSPDRYGVLTNFDLDGRGRRRVEKALRQRAPEFGDRPIVIWGAAEIAAFLTSRPHLRHAFFGEEQFSTVDTALEELRRSQRDLPWPEEFLNRERLLAEIRRFVEGDTRRVLHVHGPRFVGKTRTVAEALLPASADVIWARTPAFITDGLIRALDAEPRRVVLVIDECDLTQREELANFLLATQRLKTITIGTSAQYLVGLELLQVRPLTHDVAHRMARIVAPDVPGRARSWLVDVSDGSPGILLHAAWLTSGVATTERLSKGTSKEMLASLLWDRLTAGLSAEQLQYLQMLAVLSPIRITEDENNELETIARAFDLDSARARQFVEDFEQRDIMLVRGPYREVVPPVLAMKAAANAFKERPDAFEKLLFALPNTSVPRLLDRVADLEHVPQMELLVKDLLSATTFLSDPEGLLRVGPNITPFARRDPRAFLCRLRSLFKQHGTEWLHETEYALPRGRILQLLEGLVMRAGHFDPTASLLLDIAETEPKGLNARASDAFCSLFFYQHPEVGASLAVRASFLREELGRRSSRGRRILAGACQAFAGSPLILMHRADDAEPSRDSGLPRYWKEIFDYAQEIIGCLGELLADDDEATRVAAADAFIERFQDFIWLRSGQGAVSLAEVAVNVLGGVDARRQLHDNIGCVLSQIEDPELDDQRKELYVPIVPALAALKASLFRGSPGLELQRWAGTLPLEDAMAETESDRPYEELPREGHLKRLAASLADNPAAVERDRLDWLFSVEAHHAGRFFYLLGKCDRGGRWLEPLIERRKLPRGASNFVPYVKGASEAGHLEPDLLLDQLMTTPDVAEQLVLPGTVSGDVSPASMDRFMLLARPDHLGPRTAARQLADSAWTRGMSSGELEQVLAAIGRPDAETAVFLVALFSRRTWQGEVVDPPLRRRGWEALELALPALSTPYLHEWESLAVRLAEQEIPRLLELLEKLVSTEAANFIFRGMRGGRLTRLLREHARPQYLRLLITAYVSESPAAVSIGFHVRDIVEPDRDSELLIESARLGPQYAESIGGLLDASKEGFWRLVGALLSELDDPSTERLESRLSAVVASTGVVKLGPEGFALIWEQRMNEARSLLEHSSMRVRRWAVDTIEWLDRQAKKERKGDHEWLWDHPFSQEEFREMVRRRDTPERTWALKRLLQRAPSRDVLRFLTIDDIQEGLDLLPDDDRVRPKWETFLRARHDGS